MVIASLHKSRVLCILFALCLPLAPPLRADDTYSSSAARLEKMSAEQKDDLRRKKLRFDELSADDKQRLRDLHQSITNDTNSKELLDTAVGYNRWLATLDPTERSALLDIKDPQSRIERIKELIQQQEARRFRQYFVNLPEKDRETVFKWLEDFVMKHADAIIDKLPHESRQRIAEAADEDARRRALLGSWLRRQREYRFPWPGAEDHAQLLQQLSTETQKMIESSAQSELSKEPEDQRTPERQQALQHRKIEELVRTALYSRVFPQISQDELMKYYDGLKGERRRQLEGLEGEELRRELQRLYNSEHGFGGRGGPPPGSPGGRGGFGPSGGWPGPPRGDGPGRDGPGRDGPGRDGPGRGDGPPRGDRPPPFDGPRPRAD